MIEGWWFLMRAHVGSYCRPFFSLFTNPSTSVIPAVIRTRVITTAIIPVSYSSYASYPIVLFLVGIVTHP